MLLQIGFIGLGNMGSRMAKNLVNDGHQLVVHDRSISAMEEICKLGATSAFNPEDVASEEGASLCTCNKTQLSTRLAVYCPSLLHFSSSMACMHLQLPASCTYLFILVDAVSGQDL